MTDAPAVTLEERVARLEAAMWPLLITTPEEWTQEQHEGFEAELKRQMGDEAWKRREVRILHREPVLTPETARALLSERVTVVRPGETLVIRVPDSWTPNQAREYQRYADEATERGRIPFKVLVVTGDEFAVVQPASDEAFATRVLAVVHDLRGGL